MGLPTTWESFRQYIIHRKHTSPARLPVIQRSYHVIERFFVDKEYTIDGVYLYLDSLIDRNMKESSINVHIRYLRHICACAGLAWGGEIGYRREQEVVREYLTPDEVVALVHCHPPRQRMAQKVNERWDLVIMVLLATGMRRSELCSVRWEDLRGDKIVVHKTKTKTSKTCVLMPDLARRLQNLPRESPYIFGYRDYPLRAQSINDEIHTRCKILGITKTITAHCLRYTAAKEASKRGANLAFIQKFLGHRDANTTSKYIQADEDDIRTVATRLTVNLPYVDKSYAQDRIDALISELQIAGFRCDREKMMSAAVRR